MNEERLIELCKEMSWQDIDLLIDSLEELSDLKFNVEYAARDKAERDSIWLRASQNINNFLTNK